MELISRQSGLALEILSLGLGFKRLRVVKL